MRLEVCTTASTLSGSETSTSLQLERETARAATCPRRWKPAWPGENWPAPAPSAPNAEKRPRILPLWPPAPCTAAARQTPDHREQQRDQPPPPRFRMLPTFLPALLGALAPLVDAIRACLHSVLEHLDRIAALLGQSSLVALLHVRDAAQRQRDLPLWNWPKPAPRPASASFRASPCCPPRASCLPWPRSAGRWRARGCCGTACPRRSRRLPARPRRRCVRITSTRSLGRIRRPAAVSSLMRVEMARMPAGRIAASTPPSPAFTSFSERDRLTRQHRRAGNGAGEVVDGVGPRAPLDILGVGRALRPILPAEILRRR